VSACPSHGINDTNCKSPLPLIARLNKLTIKVNRPKRTPDDIKMLETAEFAAVDGAPLRHGQSVPQVVQAVRANRQDTLMFDLYLSARHSVQP
jgi:hypothetical protein